MRVYVDTLRLDVSLGRPDSKTDEFNMKIVFSTEEVSLGEVRSDIAQVTLHDRKNKNTFTAGLLQGLLEAFENISKNKNYKAVILTGYDNYLPQAEHKRH